jgi:hypothetical protein
MVESHPSVAVLLYHRQKQAVILVRQFRPAVYVSACREAEAAGKPKPPLAGTPRAGCERFNVVARIGCVLQELLTEGCKQPLRRWRFLVAFTLYCWTALLCAAGFTYELCAGIIDKPGLDLKQITREEVSHKRFQAGASLWRGQRWL